MSPVVQSILLVGGAALRMWMPKAVYTKLNQLDKHKSALRKFFGW